MQYVAHLFVGEVLDGLILLTKRGDSIHSCGKLKGLDEVIDIVMHAQPSQWVPYTSLQN